MDGSTIHAPEDYPILSAESDTLVEVPASRNRFIRYGAAAASLTLAVLLGSYVISARTAQATFNGQGMDNVKATGVVGLMSGSTGAATAVDDAAAVTAGTPPQAKVWQGVANQVFVTEGTQIGEGHGDAASCQAQCDQNAQCFSFSMCGWSCYFKSLDQTGTEPTKYNPSCTSFFKSNGYFPADKDLLQPNPAPALTFYIYMAVSNPPFYPPSNNNAGSLAGILWYLHNEVVKTCTGEGFLASGGEVGDRKFGIHLLRRLKLTMKAPLPIKNLGMNFGPLQSYDSGETTGPHLYSPADGVGTGWDSTNEWQKFGFNVGCGYVGQWPHDTEPGGWTSGNSYPDCIWYSLTGPCPQMPRSLETTQCDVQFPGGVCHDPTGQGNCTYHTEDAGWIDIDELVGIKPKWPSRKEFCQQCHVEGGPYTPQFQGGCGMNWWGPNIWTDKTGNAQRVQKALAFFEKKYPKCTGSPSDVKDCTEAAFLNQPKCDFNKQAYERAGGATFQR